MVEERAGHRPPLTWAGVKAFLRSWPGWESGPIHLDSVMSNSLETVTSFHRTNEPSTAPRIGLSKFDQLGLERLVVGDASAAVEDARALAEALSRPDRDEVRLRTISRGVAVAKTTVDLLEALLMERLAKRDVEGVELTERVLRATTARLVKLLEAHRLESSQQRRVAVVVTHADEIHIDGVG